MLGNLPKKPAKLENRGLHVGSGLKSLGKNRALTSNFSPLSGKCMPNKRDPFADKRKTSNGIPPKQAKRKREVKRVTDTRKIPKATRELNALKKEMSSTEKKLAVKQQLLEMMSQAPTPAQQRKMVLAMFEDAGFNPLQALIEFVTEKDADGNASNAIAAVLIKPSFICLLPFLTEQLDARFTFDFSMQSRASFALFV